MTVQLMGIFDPRQALTGTFDPVVRLRGRVGLFVPPDPLPAWALPAGVNRDDVVAAYDFAAASSPEEAYVNLASPGTHDLVAWSPVPDWTLDDGAIFTGHQWLETDIYPVADQTWSLMIWFSDSLYEPETNGCFASAASSIDDYNFFLLHRSAMLFICSNGGLRVISAPAQNTGSLAIAGKQVYWNGQPTGSPLGTPNGRSAQWPLVFGAHIVPGGIKRDFGQFNLRGAAVWNNAALTASQVAAVEAAFLAGEENWWLAGDIPADHVVAAYRLIGAANKTAAYTNLVNPGTHTLTESSRFLDFTPGVGITADPTLLGALDTGILPTTDQSWSSFIHHAPVVAPASATFYGADSLVHGALYSRLSNLLTSYNGVFSSATNITLSAGTVTETHGVAGNRAHRNGALVGGTLTPTADGQPAEIALMGIRFGTTFERLRHLGEGTLKRAAFYRVPLTETQIVELHAAMLAADGGA